MDMRVNEVMDVGAEKKNHTHSDSNIKVSVKNLSAFFGKTKVLDSISLDVHDRKVLAIIGPSGCGKSTFLRSLNRMHEVIGGTISGEIIFDGEDIMKIDPVYLRRRIGMVFQKANPFPTLYIANNVVVGLKMNGFRKKKILDEIIEKSLRQAALWDEVKDVLKNSGASLSGGQQQRLCIARALAVQPEIILMDEPASALDPISTAKIEELIFELKKKYTIVIVTHNMQQASRVSDYTAFLYMGRLIEVGKTSNIFTAPKLKQTEDYVTGRFG
jgi:phosphate transport system ATP-binding protein